MNLTKRTELRRIPDRGSHDWATINQILDAGFLAHVGFCLDGQPFVIPTLYGRDGERLYLHGSAASRMLRELETGVAACVPMPKTKLPKRPTLEPELVPKVLNAVEGHRRNSAILHIGIFCAMRPSER
jgi:integrase